MALHVVLHRCSAFYETTEALQRAVPRSRRLRLTLVCLEDLEPLRVLVE